MKTKALILVSTLGLLLTGCNSTSNSADDGSQANNGYRCKQVRSLGSNIPKTSCSTSKQRAEARKNAQDALRENQRGLTNNDR
ncbi:hypothetical protein [Pseudoalteromonas sp. OOF1S-7]|uniref:hypothetical protein n=1 Tax=Pseudoalteromonas sp. OOF1S-7 TaxID=2917757 RepID=UPI001EF55601|nr:hypothetical protein [Pseudoalteromonas sp. OOF1S-7]MCG7533824.1 hypothetical protein [Pseudoalteromonas sp. OOF1S-7]